MPIRGTDPSPAKIAFLLFCSGLCALIYQTAWLREFRLVFGATTPATAAVLAIFMGGLGLGSAVLGNRSERQARPLLFYGQLELLIALSAALTPALLWLVRHLYIATGGTQTLGLTAGTVIRLGLSAVVLALPTFLMGGTLPAAARAAETDTDPNRRRLALLYGANTLGAVTGAVLATFVLFEQWGNRTTLWAACALNATVALVAMRLGRAPASIGAGGEISPGFMRAWRPETGSASSPALRAPCPVTSSPHPSPPSDGGEGARRAGEEALQEPGRQAPARREAEFQERAELELGAPVPAVVAAPPLFVLSAAAIVGFAFLLMEIVWYRMLAPLLGGTTFTFGLILAMALLGIGLGGAGYAVFSGRGQATLRAFAFTCALEALCLAAPFALGDRVAVLAVLLRPMGSFEFYGHVLAWSIVAGVVVLPAALVAGFQFPLLISLLGTGAKDIGRHTGQAYAWNTAGAIAGSLAGGFGLLPLLTAPGIWRGLVVLLAGLGVVAVMLTVREGRLRWNLAGSGVLALLALGLLRSDGPTAAWRHSPIGAGRVGPEDFEDRNKMLDWRQKARRTDFWEAEGREVSLTANDEDGLAFIVNGKSDGSARNDAGTQVMSGLMGALLHPKPASAFVVGLGTGSTAGWLGAVPSIQRVDVVELEPAILTFAGMCAPVNHGVMTNSRVNIIVGDAREVLLSARGRYDLIVSEPSNLYRAGVASLYTREFYRAASSRLNDGGLFLQFMQAYETDIKTLRTVFGTVCSVFPHVETWCTEENDLLFVASRQPLTGDVPALRARLQQEPFKTALEKVWRVNDLEGVLAHYLASEPFCRLMAGSAREVNTDDRMVLEYSLARSVGQESGRHVATLRSAAQDRDMDRPNWTNAPIDWPAAYRQQSSVLLVEGMEPLSSRVTGRAADRIRAMRSYAADDLDEALKEWVAYGGEPGDLVELAMAAELFANAGDPRALPYLERLRVHEPVESTALLARYHWRQHHAPEAVDALEAALTAYRDDPWPLPMVMERALTLAETLSQADTKDKVRAKRLLLVLARPFALRLLNEKRLRSSLSVARSIDGAGFSDYTLKALEAYGPHVPWKREFLKLRLDCYEHLSLPFAAARRDWHAFLKNEPPELDLDEPSADQPR